MLYINYCGHHFSGLLNNPTDRISYGELYLFCDKSVDWRIRIFWGDYFVYLEFFLLLHIVLLKTGNVKKYIVMLLF